MELEEDRLLRGMMETTAPVVVKCAVGSAAPQQGVFEWSQQLHFCRIIGHPSVQCQPGLSGACSLLEAYKFWPHRSEGVGPLSGEACCSVKLSINTASGN